MRAVEDPSAPPPMESGGERKGAERQDTHVAPVLPERAASAGPGSTRAVKD